MKRAIQINLIVEIELSSPVPASLSGDMYRMVPTIVCARSCRHEVVGGMHARQEDGERGCQRPSLHLSIMVSLPLLVCCSLPLAASLRTLLAIDVCHSGCVKLRATCTTHPCLQDNKTRDTRETAGTPSI